MKRYFLLTMVVIFILSACTTPATPIAQEPSATAQPAPSNTPLPSATATSLPTNTPAPTDTPLPTATLPPTATPVPQVISGQSAAQMQLVRRYGNGQIVQTLWSPDAKQLLVLTTVHLKAFDPASGEIVWETETGAPQVEMAFTPDGKSIVTLSKDGTAKTWDAATGKENTTVHESQDGIDYCDLSGSGNVVALLSSGKETTLWDLAGDKKLATINGAAFPMGVTGVLVTPDDATVWVGGFDSGERQQIQATEVKTGKFKFALLGIDWNFMTEMAISPDSTKIAGISRLALTSEAEYTFMVWDTANARQLSKTKFKEDIDAFAFLPGQEQAVVASGGAFSLVDLRKGEIGSSFGLYTSTLASLAVSADGKLLSAAGTDGVVAIYDLSTNTATKEIKLELSQAVPPYRMSGKNYIVRADRYVGIGADPAGKFIAVLNPDRTGIDLVDPAGLSVSKTVGKSAQPLSTFDVSSDGSLIAAVDEDNVVLLYDAASGSQKNSIQTGHKNNIRKIELSPDNKQVATVSGGELYLWDTDSGNKLFTLSGYNTMGYAPDGKTIVSDNIDFGIYVWDATNGKQLAAPAADWIYDLVYSPDGSTIAISGFEVHKRTVERENLITLLDAKTNKNLPMKLIGHPAIITEVVFAPDGKILVTADDHGNIRLWNVETGEIVKEIREAAPAPLQILFTNEGRTLVLGSVDGTLRFYEAQ